MAFDESGSDVIVLLDHKQAEGENLKFFTCNFRFGTQKFYEETVLFEVLAESLRVSAET